MKITLLQALKAYQAINDLSNQATDFSTAHTLVLAKQDLEVHAKFYADKEQEIVRKYAQRGADGELLIEGNQFKVSTDQYENFFKEKAELDAVLVTVPDRELKPMQSIRPCVLESLIPVFTFSE